LTTADIPDPDDDRSAGTARPTHGVRNAVLVLVSVAAVFIVLGLVVLAGQNDTAPDPLDADAHGLSDVTFRSTGCTYEPDRGGLVAHFDVRTSDAGRFTVDVSAVTQEALDNADITTPHVVRYTLPFYGGQSHKEFDVVVPLSEAEYQQGYRKCRYNYGDA
jgi:hypothetical protein